MKRKLTRSMLMVALASILMALLLVLPRVYQAFERRALDEIENVSIMLRGAMEAVEDKGSVLKRAREDMPQIRLTWIDATGEVLYDSAVAQPSGMENHAGREEVQEAMEAGIGSATRRSTSIGENTYYYALRLPDGSILRAAKTERSVAAELAGLLPSFVLIGLLTIAISSVLAGLLTRRLIAPINRLDLDRPEENDVDEELIPLLKRLMEQNQRIAEQIRANREYAAKTAAITENMAEGLVMLSMEGRIVSINRSAARRLGGTVERFAGSHYITACRDIDFTRHIEQALSGVRCEAKMPMGGRVIQMLANPVYDEGRQTGAILLFLDITDQARAEATRREFSANVSHELKTPLTTIAGYAEMMRAGLSNADDNVDLAGKIHGEARRLLALIEDIIKLSRLDENAGRMSSAPVNLYEAAQSVVERMRPFARERGVTVSLEGRPLYVMGSRTLLEEMAQNLLDNAIRYNRAGGGAKLALEAVGDTAKLVVSDTGVGIAPEHHDRIFERFYRVDKSHSRETGGTGLGLSIVKHCVKNHGGNISLDSKPGKGTRIEVALPRCDAGPGAGAQGTGLSQ